MLTGDTKRFFKLFKDSTFKGSRAVARKMKEIAKRQSKHNQKFLLFHSILFLVHFSDSEMLFWPNSPLLVLLQFVDPNMLSRDEHEPLEEGAKSFTPLHMLAELADPCDYSTHKNQVILAKQLIDRGTNVNAVSIPQGRTPLHSSCEVGNVTNLDFIELLLKAGADPNARDHMEMTPLMWTTSGAPGAATFLLNWPATDVNITTRSGVTFLSAVRLNLNHFTDEVALPDNPDQVQHQFLLQQWSEIKEMLVERGL
jgi:hypothetical protein